MLKQLFISLILLSLVGCSSWVYRLDIPQGNFLDKQRVEKLQLGMTKEQVKFVLGSPVLSDAFNDDIWHYVYRFKSGKDASKNIEKQFTVSFENNKLVKAEGDFELPESFYTPIQN